MKKNFVLALSALALLSVSCQEKTLPEQIPGTVEKTFTVTAPASTRTELSGMNILWSADDEINVIAVNSGNQYTFRISDGTGTTSAKFTGTLNADDAEETEFYAVYPNVAIRPTSLSSGLIEFDKTFGRSSKAVKDGFDANRSVLTAQSDGNALTFRHGSAYFKVKVAEEGVDSLVITTSNARFSGRPKYNLDGSYNNIEGAKADVVLAPVSGTLEKDATYYIPVFCKNSTIKTLTLKAYYHNGKTCELSTDKKSSVKLALGTVYDLGCPDISTDPKLIVNTTSVSGIASSAADGLKIENAYTVKNGSDSDISSVTCDGIVVTAANISSGTVTYSISVNSGATRSGWIGLTLAGAEVQKITVEQLGSGVTENYTWDFSDDDWITYLATAGNKNTDISSWTFTRNGLYFYSEKSKWNVSSDTYYIQFGGTSGASSGIPTKHYFKFSTTGKGTVTVTASGTNTSARKVYVSCGGTEQSADTACTNTTAAEYAFDVNGGDVYIYAKDGALRFYKIKFQGE